MAYDSVHVDPDAAGAALRSWQAAVQQLERVLQSRAAAIEDAEASRPWGGDNGGPLFADVYRQGAVPSRDAVQAMTRRLVELGMQVGTAIQASLASDEAQAAALAPAQARLDAGR
jgi:multidrug resistance efflux pump